MRLGDDPTPERLGTALAFVCEGRAVSFGGFSLVVHNGCLQVDIDYGSTTRDDVGGAELIRNATIQTDRLIEDNVHFRTALASLPRRYALINDEGTTAVEVAYLSDGGICWH
jgi:hypothetical protein